MIDLLDELNLSRGDSLVEEAAASGPARGSTGGSFRYKFNQNEDFFVELDSPVVVPRLPIHHDVRRDEPGPEYSGAMALAVRRLAEAAPEAFEGLRYAFDPADILRPAFFAPLDHGSARYLYILRFDLLMKPYGARVITPGTNDLTPEYETKRVFFESELVPIRGSAGAGERVFKLMPYVSDTWIGETGKGYQVRGIWMDNDLTRFFTKIFLPPDRRMHPFYPLFCKYKSICCFVPGFGTKARERMLPFVTDAIGYLVPEMDRIQSVLRHRGFSEELPDFTDLRDRAPEAWRDFFGGVAVSAYLNEWDMKEYSFDFPALLA